MRFMVVPGKVAAKQSCDFLRRLMHGVKRPIFLIIDGHPVHRSAKVKTLVASFKGKLELFYLPPYSPELNPDEWAWNDLKNNALGRMKVAGPDDMKQKVISHLKWMQRTPDLIQSFFHASTTKYAA
jgi:transposase